MLATPQYKRFMGSVYGVARRIVADYESLDQFRVALIIQAVDLGKGRVSYATRLQIAKSVARQVWDETHGGS